MGNSIYFVVGGVFILVGVAISNIETSGDWPVVFSYGFYAYGAWYFVKGCK